MEELSGVWNENSRIIQVEEWNLGLGKACLKGEATFCRVGLASGAKSVRDFLEGGWHEFFLDGRKAGISSSTVLLLDRQLVFNFCYIILLLLLIN